MRRGLAAVLATLALVAPPLAARAAGRPTVDEIAKKVVCIPCGTTLATGSGPAADQERRLVETLIDRGLTEDQILLRLKLEYGPDVLADPGSDGGTSGTLLAAIIVGAVLVGGAIVAVTVRAWRRPASASPAGALVADAPPPPDPAHEPDPRLAAYLRELD